MFNKLMQNTSVRYSLNLWLTVAAVSFVLFQLPLYYYAKVGHTDNSYLSLLWEFVKNWSCVMIFMVLEWLLSFRVVNRLYQPYWSARGYKLALFFTSEFFMLFAFVLYFFFFASNYFLPTLYIIIVFAISNGISVFLHKYDVLSRQLYQFHLDHE